MLDHDLERRFCRARRAAIALEFQNLNEQQREGVLDTEGPLLLLAGAGSGKTTVLISRIANLMRFGRGSDSPEVPDWVTEEDVTLLERYVNQPGEEDRSRAMQLAALEPAAPWSILAITFTNKAAGELKERLARMLGAAANDVWASTFHSACVRILRRDIEKLGFVSGFTIYDTDDSLRVVKDILKERNIDDKMFPPRTLLGYFSRAKDEMKLADEYLAECRRTGDFRLQKIAELYQEYQRRLWEANALDFDDIILHTVRLLRQDEQVRAYYQRKFRYVLIDEYQDTNNLQYLLASTLAGGYENFCVVGDDDQSIYRFRGATIENILSFESQYRNARVIRLEQNYRSTGNILEAANAVIRNNQGRKGKELWTRAPAGEKLQLYTAMNESDEAQYVAARILEDYAGGQKWSDHAILYRMNAQSSQMEYACKRNGIPYRNIGGTRFFDRAEVKDMLAYLCVLNNPDDDLRLVRILNNPPRGIGDKTVEMIREIADAQGTSLYRVIAEAERWPQLQKAAAKLSRFADLIEELTAASRTEKLPDLYEQLIDRTGYAVMLETKNTVEDRTRLENVRELLTSINSYLENAGDEPSLAGFLDEIALYTDLDSMESGEDCVVMMTMHAAKGLEFPVVFLVGVEEGVFPGMRVIGEPEEMEEERRLCYVAMTRAKQRLYLTCASQRMLFGHTTSNRVSRFVEEVPEHLLTRTGRSFLDREDDGGESRDGFPSRASGYNGYRSLNGRGGYAARPDGARSTVGPSRYPLPGSARTALAGASRPAARPVAAGPSAARPSTPLPEYQKGDMVLHKAFGRGMVISTQKTGGDVLIEIAFDNVGTKRLMLKFAAAQLSKA